MERKNGAFGMDPMDWWLTEIEREKLFPWIDGWNWPVRYWSRNRNWANLVRYDASRIGCAEHFCDRGTKHVIFCLTDQPPLQNGDIVYYWGKGACPRGACRPPNDGCNIETGLCFRPIVFCSNIETKFQALLIGTNKHQCIKLGESNCVSDNPALVYTAVLDF
ncbi:hypothetical protein ANCCAN_00669 [Ancylostoma caninum]|uniref:SCP domain-containing protein n=1 Tax=Ancylostoma caninum TaxID=29170 RepID=A0A368H984_ANCCA|nr:hypothetical protein ANCCAN_00669 [Ancylostoma caninum]